ncbi:GNAT family N-acetyltransferase [Rouxiella badensis]|nr:GNAT family N-acetyltransferase [Rouxiella badensis]
MTSRLIYQDESMEIRVPTELEAPLHFDAIQSSMADISAWESWCSTGYSLEDSRTYLIDSYVKRQRGQEYRFCLFDLASGKIIGSIALNRIVPEYKTANIGYWIRSDFTGRSLAVTAVKAIARFAFNESRHDETRDSRHGKKSSQLPSGRKVWGGQRRTASQRALLSWTAQQRVDLLTDPRRSDVMSTLPLLE